MGFQNGSFSLTRYRVLGREKRLSISELNKKFAGFQAGPLKLQNSSHELEYAWVLPENPELDDKKASEDNWTLSDCLFEDGILLRIQMEKRNVPTQLLNIVAKRRWLETKAEEADAKAEERVQKKQIVDEVKEELLRMSLPTLSYIDAFWKDQEDSIYLFSQGKAARECFEDLFRKTFGQAHNLTLIRILPPILGLDVWSGGDPDVLEKIRQTLPGGMTGIETS
ncbi:MAG: recombination-associated protein RdgC [Chitinophagaceae bacterium]|nr:recombination-associated protein RdgC [Oligoflexus sp.]